MNLDHFLQIWSRHNITIIEVLIGLILVMIVYLAFRAFFSTEQEPGVTAGALNSAEIEKTLQKILEVQGNKSAGEGGALSADAAAEVAKLKSEIAEKEQQLASAKAEAAKAGGAAVDPQLVSGFESKVKDLEARLAEYEIISEDIADLSFYKEENSKLQREIEALKGGKVAAPAAPAPAAVAPAPAPTEPAAPVEAAPAPAPAAQVEAAPAPAATSSVDDDLMKEFAAAVQGQQMASGTAEPAPPPPAASVNSDNAQLLNQFENFVKKD